MAGVMMALGPFRFSVDTAAYKQLRRDIRFDWRRLNRLGNKPKLQFLGADAEAIELSGTIYPQYRGGLTQIEQIEVLAGTGKPLLMVDGLGFVWGKYCVLGIGETREAFFENGVPRKIGFTISLLEYSE